MTDIAPELYSAIEAAFRRAINGDATLQAIIDRAASNEILYEDAYRAAERIGRHASRSLLENLSADQLPDGRLYYNIAGRVVRPILEESYTEAAALATAAQRKVNELRGIMLDTVTPSPSGERIGGIIDRLTDGQPYTGVSWLLGDPVELLTLNAVTDTVRENAELQYDAGLKTVVIREATANCCRWCSNLAGSYDYAAHRKTGDDIWRRHENCKCRVYVDNHTGRVQDAHTKRSYDPQEIIESYLETGNVKSARHLKEELITRYERERAEYVQKAAEQQRARIEGAKAL